VGKATRDLSVRPTEWTGLVVVRDLAALPEVCEHMGIPAHLSEHESQPQHHTDPETLRAQHQEACTKLSSVPIAL
jgi:hypothetical protein